MISDAIFIVGTLEHCRKTVELQSICSIIINFLIHPSSRTHVPLCLRALQSIHNGRTLSWDANSGWELNMPFWFLFYFLDCDSRCKQDYFKVFLFILSFRRTITCLTNIPLWWMKNFINFQYFACRFNPYVRALLSLQEGSLWESRSDWERAKSNAYLLHCHR